MKNYNEISDFELSKLVFFKSGKPYEEYESNPFPDYCSSFSYGDGANWHEFDINNPSDMWPLIVENGICLISPIKPREKWTASWFIEGGNWSINDAAFSDKNPLRAAAIVYLMIKD